MSILLDNKILQAAEQKIESQLTAETRDAYMKIVVSGMKVALDGGPNSMIASLKKTKDPIGACALGAVRLVILMRDQAKGVMPPQAQVYAGMTLMLQALDFADRTGIVKVGAPELVKATHHFTEMIFQAFHITMPVLNRMADMTHGVTQDPTKMEMIARRAGIVKDPRTSTPTEMPAEAPAKPAPRGMINKGADNGV